MLGRWSNGYYASERNIPMSGRKRSYTPLPFDYHPELETYTMLETEDVTTYQEFVGMLRWACELGRIDILLKTAIMSQYLAAPRKGHLDKLFNIFRTYVQICLSLYLLRQTVWMLIIQCSNKLIGQSFIPMLRT